MKMRKGRLGAEMLADNPTVLLCISYSRGIFSILKLRTGNNGIMEVKDVFRFRFISVMRYFPPRAAKTTLILVGTFFE